VETTASVALHVIPIVCASNVNEAKEHQKASRSTPTHIHHIKHYDFCLFCSINLPLSPKMKEE
jgi:hypothetical protein